jgi:hypothetical protein
MSLEPRPVGVEPRPADGPAFVLCFQHVSINIIFLSPFAAFPLPHSETPIIQDLHSCQSPKIPAAAAVSTWRDFAVGFFWF